MLASLVQSYKQACDLLQTVANEIDEFYKGRAEDDSTGAADEIFGPFTVFDIPKEGTFVQECDGQAEQKYITWPNLQCLRDDIRKFLEG